MVGGQNSKPTRAHLCLICVLNAPMQKWEGQCNSFIPQILLHSQRMHVCEPYLTAHRRQVPHATDDGPATHHPEQIIHHPKLTAVPEGVPKPRVILEKHKDMQMNELSLFGLYILFV